MDENSVWQLGQTYAAFQSLIGVVDTAIYGLRPQMLPCKNAFDRKLLASPKQQSPHDANTQKRIASHV